MKIIIDYESSWRNSFLDGSNNESLPKKGNKVVGRNFVGSMTRLRKAENFIKREVTLDTVMGVLNRIIGDQRKLYQAREDINYFFKDIDVPNHPLIKFDDLDHKRIENNEMTYIRNITGSTDQNSFTGAINVGHPLLSSDYSSELWGILDLTLEELIQFLLGKNDNKLVTEEINPLLIGDKLSTFKDVKIDSVLEKENISNSDIIKAVEYLKNDVSINSQLKKQFPRVQKVFSDIEYIKNEKVVVRALYCSSLYIQAIRLSKKYDMDGVVLKGFSVNGFTPKDFMSLFTGGKKKIYGNPYIYEEFIKGEGKVKHLMTKASGKLEIEIDVDKDKAKKIEYMINCAGVSSFYLGKKGLAYVSNIDTRPRRS